MLNKNNERELAYVVKINKVEPIEGYDRVEYAHINGWGCVVPKGAFKEGDLGVYFEIDSKCPAVEPFLFLEKRKYHVKTQKMCKRISQGLLMSFADFGWENDKYKEGTFLTKELGITYYEPEDNVRKSNAGVDKYKKMAQRHGKLFSKQPFRWLMKRDWGRKILFVFFGKKRDKRGWPAWVVKTDEERIQNMPYILQDKEPWIATEKIDGTSTTFTIKRKPFGKFDFYICSRNVVFDKPDKVCFYDTNVYVEMAVKYKIEEVLTKLMKTVYKDEEWITLQGETYGEGIQKRDYNLEWHNFMGFNFITASKGRMNSKEAADMFLKYGIPWVPIIDENFILPDTVEELLDYATGTSVIDGGMREGVVFRSQDGVKSFKAVSNEFLLKYHQ